MNFGPAEMAQTMAATKALITVTMFCSVGIGIVLAAVVALYHFPAPRGRSAPRHR